MISPKIRSCRLFTEPWRRRQTKTLSQ